MKVVISIALVYVLVPIVCTTSIKTVWTGYWLAKRNETRRLGSTESYVLPPPGFPNVISKVQGWLPQTEL
jgi:hypothetical protein